MPRWASRIILEITGAKAERLQGISEHDANAEGFASIDDFFAYWDTMNLKRGYGLHKNPWVWVIEFKRLEQ